MVTRSARWSLAVIACLTMLLVGCKTLIVGKGYPDYGANLSGLPLNGPVKIMRDAVGIPHIYAQDEHDLMVAQGFVHAQDRLWQMETLRRVATGRLAEIAGESRVNLDFFSRLLGFPELRRRAAAALSPQETALLQAYVDGINVYIRSRGKNLPLEFGSAGFVPEPWQVEDVFSFVTLNAWSFQQNYIAELAVLAGRQRVAQEEWKDIFPDYPGAVIPDDNYFEGLRSLKLGRVNRWALSFFNALPDNIGTIAGTNLWVTAHGPGGKPLLANDTHVGISIPGTWYLCHLNAPGVDAAGASAPGLPGIVVGHTQSVAWGISILPVDSLDLYVVRVDPADPTRYYVGDRTLVMERQNVVLAVKGAKPRTMSAYRTVYGPVITAVEPGIEGAVALRWYGTIPEGQLVDGTVRTVLRLFHSRKAADVGDAAQNTRLVGLNFVVADDEGTIAWQAAGAVPIRKGYSGRLPADGSSGTMDWDGFAPASQMPSVRNPPEGYIVNCNNRPVGDDYPWRISNSWSAPYRHDRVVSLLGSAGEPSIEQFRAMQMDVYSPQAEALLPRILSYSYADPLASEAARMLKGWDRQVRVDSQGAAVWEAFLSEFVRALLGDEMGVDLFYYYNIQFSRYLVQDVILDRPDSGLWDRRDTPQKEGPPEILSMALNAAMQTLKERLGDNRASWSWGRLHPIVWKHAGATSALTSMLLNVGPFPVAGDAVTLNAQAPNLARGEYRSIHIPAVRMITSLADLNGMQIVVPLGQSGQPGHTHYDDMVKPWLEGGMFNLPVNEAQVKASIVSTLTLSP